MNRTSWKLAPLLAAIVLLGAGCEQSDIDLVMNFANEWAKAKGIVGENGAPTGKAIGRALFGASTGDDQADAAVDAGLVVKNIKDADDKAAKAQSALAQDPPDRATAEKELNGAVRSRPNDWALRNQRGVLRIEAGDKRGGDDDLVAAAQACNPKRLAGAGSTTCLKRQHVDEERLLKESIQRQQRGGGLPRCETYRQQEDNYSILAYNYGPSDQDRDRYAGLSSHAKALSMHPGETCRSP